MRNGSAELGARHPLGRRWPEGPYESKHLGAPIGISGPEMIRFLDFVEQMEERTKRCLALTSGYREMRLLIHLVRNHLRGRVTTASSLAAASGLSYGTAMRAITECQERGLIARRPRTATGKSFSLHPTADLLEQWGEYAHQMHALFHANYLSDLDPTAANHVFGGLHSGSEILPLPTILPTRLDLAGDLRVLVHADPTFMAMHALKNQIQIILGVGIQTRALSIDRLHQEILSNGRSDVSRYDIIACDLPWFGELANKRNLMPLDDLMSAVGFDTSDFYPSALASARFRGAQYGIPVQTTPELLVYRRDLFGEAGLAEPATVDLVLQAARALHNPRRGRYGIAWNGARGTPLGHTFLFAMAAFGQPIIDLARTKTGFDIENVDLENMRPMFLSPEALQAAEYLRELMHYSPPTILSMSWYERTSIYASGGVGMAYCYSLLAELFELDSNSPAYGQTAYLPHPAGPRGRPVAPVGGYALAIPSNIPKERIDPVWTAVQFLTSPSMTKLYIQNGSVVSQRFSVSRDPQVRSVAPIIPAVDQMAGQGLLQTWPRPPVPEMAEIIGIAGEHLHDALSGRISIREALSRAQNRADGLMQSRGYF